MCVLCSVDERWFRVGEIRFVWVEEEVPVFSILGLGLALPLISQ